MVRGESAGLVGLWPRLNIVRRRKSFDMSDNFITLIPEDPRFVPEAARQHLAREWFAEFAPAADEIEIKTSERVEFFHCGGYLQSIRCPSCRAAIAIEWWQDRMDEDYGEGFKLADYPVPCCGAKVTLHELEYEAPQGFGLFGLEAMNPNIGMLKDKDKRELEKILGAKLRVIYHRM